MTEMLNMVLWHLYGFVLGTIHGLPLIIALVIWGLKMKRRLESE